MTRTLLRGGLVLTMDDALGDLAGGDVLIDGARIAAVGPRLVAAADEVVDCSGRIVLPGLIDGHAHLWQTPIRGVAGEAWAGEEVELLRSPAARVRPHDLRAATFAGAVDLLRRGVTTVLDVCDAAGSPDHAAAAIEALRGAGIRALFGCRPSALAPGADAVLVAGDERALERARELGVLAVVERFGPWDVAALHARGLLGADLLWAHCGVVADEELELLAEHGGALAITPEVDVTYGGLYPLTGRALRRGVPVAFGTDAAAPDPLMQLRMALHAQRMLDAQVDHLEGRSPKRSRDVPTLTPRTVLRMGTAGAAAALGLGDRTGSLTPGKEADVLVLATEPYGLAVGDPAAHVVLQASRRDVERVYVAGRERVRDGRVLDVDLERLRADLDRARAHVAG